MRRKLRGGQLSISLEYETDTEEVQRLPRPSSLKITVLLILTLMSVAAFFLSPTAFTGFWDWLNIGRILLFIVTCYLWIFSWFGPREKYRNWVGFLGVALPIIGVGLALLSWLLPDVAHFLIRGDQSGGAYGWHGYLKAAFDVVSCLLFLTIAVLFFVRGKGYRLAGAASLLLMLLLFFMAMEEVSWGQRIFHWETTEAFSGNAQNETNLHNFATQIFQNVLYFGGFLLLIVLSFSQKVLDKFLRRAKHGAWLRHFLPSPWMAGAFAVMVGLFDPLSSVDTGLRYGSILLALIFTVMMLMFKVRERLVAGQVGRAVWTMAVLAMLVFVAAISAFNSNLHQLSTGNTTEFMETFIAFGILVYAIELRWRLLARSQRVLAAGDRDGLI